MEIYDTEGHAIVIKEKKNTIWAKIGGGSLMFAAIFHIILLIFGAYWIFQVIREPEKKIDFMPAGGGGGERGAEHQVQQKKRTQITPTTNVKRVFAEGAAATYSIPEQGDNFGEMSQLSSLSAGGMSGALGGSGSGQGFGRGNGKGTALGFGNGNGKLFGLIPETMRKRCSKADRLARLSETGGTPACEEAVVKSLGWLKSTQNADGSWGKVNQVAMTGFAVLAYLGHCETPQSEEFGDSVARGIIYLVSVGLKGNGEITTDQSLKQIWWVYEHAIATYALAESYTFCSKLKINIPDLDKVTKKAGDIIMDGQAESGSWNYVYAKGKAGDNSVGFWHIQAMKACKHTGLWPESIFTNHSKNALKWLESVQGPDGSIGYRNSSKQSPELTGGGMLAFQMWGESNNKCVKMGIRYIRDHARFEVGTPAGDLYYHYYNAQAMMNAGGADWKFYNDLFRETLLKNQQPDGSWNLVSKFTKTPHMSTCLATFMLEVYYRFLNSDPSGGGHAYKSKLDI